MLQSALPLALRKGKEERHTFQESVLEAVAGVLGDEDARLRAGVGACEGRITSLETEKAAAASKLEEAKARAETKRQDEEAKTATKDAAEAAVAAAQIRAKEEAEAQQVLVEALQECTAEKERYEKLLEGTWAPLKACTHEGKQWRERNKAVTYLVQMLQKLSVPQSLTDSLLTVLKTKLDGRGPFANIALEHGEGAITGHIAALAARSGEREKELAEAGERSAAAEEALKEAKKAESTRIEAEAGVRSLEENMKSLPTRFAQFEEELKLATSALQGFREVAAKFEALRQRSIEVAAVPAAA